MDDNSNVSDDERNVDTLGGEAYTNTAGQVVTRRPNARFKCFKHIFENMLKTNEIRTPYPVITVMLSNDSTICLTVSKAEDCSYYISQYNLESYECTF